MKFYLFIVLTKLFIGLPISGYAAQSLKCSDGRGNALELQDLPHVVGRLTLKDPSTGLVREHKIDIGTADEGLNFAVLAASPALNGEFYFSDSLDNMSAVKSVHYFSGHWGWSERISLSLRCSP